MTAHFELLQPDTEVLAALTDAGVPALLARILALRGIDTPHKADKYLKPLLADLPDPTLLLGVTDAARLIAHAMASGAKICVYGDYDADGISAAALLNDLFRRLGHPVRVFLPDRFRDGYGLHHDRLQELCDEGITLFISVDCGTTSVREIQAVRDRGANFIVCDHHALGPILPNATVLLNPQQTDCAYPDKSLSAVGVALVLAQALRRELQNPAIDLKSLIELAALGTIADMSPMHGVNRILCWHGLRLLGQTQRPGVRALAARNSKTADLSADRVGFHLAPPINAAGRMADPQTAFELLVTQDNARALELAERIDLDNNRRKDAQAIAVVGALAQAREQAGREHGVVVAGEDWHQGVVGIVANKVKDELAVPTFVLAIGEDGVARGSGRSIPGYDLVDGLRAIHADSLFERFGGHAMAAGVTLRAERIDQFRDRLQAHVAATLPLADRDRAVRVDAELTVPELTLAIVDLLDQLEPYGKGNEKPQFLLRNVELHRPTVVGKDADWCKATLLAPGNQPAWARQGVGTFCARAVVAGFSDRDRVDAVVKLERNQFRGKVELQATIVALKAVG
jgi:single-stranded-DNA-specific exonuclease